MEQPIIRKPNLEDFVRQRSAAPEALRPDELRRLMDEHRSAYRAVWGDEPPQGSGSNSGFFEVEQAFSTLPEWKDWLTRNPWCLTPDYREAAVKSIEQTGFDAPWQGRAAPSEIAIHRNNLRESLIFSGINSRCRAVVQLVARAGLPRTASVYAPESVTPLANLLKSRFPAFVGSEYLPTPAEQRLFPGTRHEDVEALSFATGSLDLYVSCEVMEHIPHLDKALEEAARVLRPSGMLIATFPFRSVDEETQVKAVLDNGTVRHLMEPEYHGNPVDPQGSLVFQIPGWDIVPRVLRSGFSRAEMVMMWSRHHGMIANLPIAVLRAIR
jgi:hypothetical protein